MIELLQVTIAASNTPQRISATSKKCSKVIIQAVTGNAASVWIGDSSVDNTADLGIELVAPPADQINLPIIIDSKGGNELELSELWLAGTQDDVINVLIYTF